MAEGTKKSGHGTQTEQGTQTPAQETQQEYDRQSGHGLSEGQSQQGQAPAWRPEDKPGDQQSSEGMVSDEEIDREFEAEEEDSPQGGIL